MINVFVKVLQDTHFLINTAQMIIIAKIKKTEDKIYLYLANKQLIFNSMET